MIMIILLAYHALNDADTHCNFDEMQSSYKWNAMFICSHGNTGSFSRIKTRK